MSRVPGATDLRDLSIPGTHETCARFSAGSAGFAQCQNRDLHWQLRAGVRYIDIRCRVYGDIFTLHHGAYHQDMVFGDVLHACRDFLATYPTETVLMRMQQEYSGDAAAYRRIFANYLDAKGWRPWFHISPSFPTLDQARGKIALMSGWPYLDEGLRFSDESLFSVQDDYKAPPTGRKQRAVDEQLRAA
ncbi:phosphatidylinositol-specific phospholipase C domain-containing protein [Streptomyces sp. NPDC048664]|uniref:phosphatidylinositol-specific phospholipase C domain-containing protein n=1 Tax=Streptomyces sp. NPDC048664 TaxID=3154505 RepID=UPI0034491EAA